ncbi:MAG: tyrosine--tRNA ligase [Caldisphaeraceae archaeon]|nr:tyrosine--tRNA ligase [Caldisphaeraceae archaeon]
MDPEEKLELIKNNLVEIITEEELKEKVESGQKLKGYLGFEPSGLAHIGMLIWMYKVKDLIDAGLDFYILEATWHAMINDKLGGNMELLRKAARLIRDIMASLGIDTGKINFIDAEKFASDKDYWALVIKVMKATTLARMKRAITIMGRSMDEIELDSSKLIYPAMQVSDILYMDLDVALGGLDQRKAHVLAREVSEKMGVKKPIALHTPILTSLLGSQRMEPKEADENAASLKMSKSKPSSAIFVSDPPDIIVNKINNAFCPLKQIEYNPILEINKYLLFPRKNFKLYIERPKKYGGDILIESYEDLERLYAGGKIHPADLKNATAKEVIKMLEPVRKLFSRSETIELVKEITRNTTR